MFAALYPGQGSQSVGMGRYLVENFNVAKLLFEEASDILSLNFKKLCFDGPESDLALTINTQPALLLVSTASYLAFTTEAEFKPTAAAGHSIGEYAACVNSHALKFSNALKAVRQRGEAMQNAVPEGEGAMAAVMGLSPNQVKKLCKWAEENSNQSPLEPANYNAPGQIVISGKKTVLDWLITNFDKSIFDDEKKSGEEIGRVKFIPLKVSAPFHCSMMKPAELKMEKVLNNISFSNSNHPIVQNYSASETQDKQTLRKNLISQVSGAVRWIECTERLYKMGVRSAIEFGNGQVLKGLCKKIQSEMEVLNLNSLEDFRMAQHQIKIQLKASAQK